MLDDPKRSLSEKSGGSVWLCLAFMIAGCSTTIKMTGSERDSSQFNSSARGKSAVVCLTNGGRLSGFDVRMEVGKLVWQDSGKVQVVEIGRTERVLLDERWKGAEQGLWIGAVVGLVGGLMVLLKDGIVFTVAFDRSLDFEPLLKGLSVGLVAGYGVGLLLGHTTSFEFCQEDIAERQ